MAFRRCHSTRDVEDQAQWLKHSGLASEGVFKDDSAFCILGGPQQRDKIFRRLWRDPTYGL